MTTQEIIAPQEGAQEVAMQAQANLIIYGGAAGSGKSHLLLMRPLQHIHDPNFSGIFFRKTTGSLIGPGGLWPESVKMYSQFGIKSRLKPGMSHVFTDYGSSLSFSHMEQDKHRLDHMGLQYSFIGFDELTHFTELQFTYLLSRLRSDADMDSYCMASCNPDADSWVLKWVDWWLDEDGYPDPEKRGKVRYYLLIEEEPVFADTAEELMRDFPDSCKVYNPNTKEYIEVPPKTFTFIGGTIFDNPILILKNPSYLSELKSLPPVEKARLLDGNWYIRPEGSSYFDRKWLNKVQTVPSEGVFVRAWDKASSEPSEEERRPDFTASVGMVKTSEGEYVIFGNYHPDNADDQLNPRISGVFRKRPGPRDALIKKQGHYDGRDYNIVLPEDPGAGGKTEYQNSAKGLLEEGLIPRKDPAPSNQSKLNKFIPFSSACESGLVSICEASFGNKETLEYWLKNLEGFRGERSTREKKDDIPDCVASGFNFLSQSRVFTLTKRNQKRVNSGTASILQRNPIKGISDLNPLTPTVTRIIR